MKEPTISNPTQDAVVAFVALVRAVRQGDRRWARQQQAILEQCGFRVIVRRGAAVAREGMTP